MKQCYTCHKPLTNSVAYYDKRMMKVLSFCNDDCLRLHRSGDKYRFISMVGATCGRIF